MRAECEAFLLIAGWDVLNAIYIASFGIVDRRFAWVRLAFAVVGMGLAVLAHRGSVRGVGVLIAYVLLHVSVAEWCPRSWWGYGGLGANRRLGLEHFVTLMLGVVSVAYVWQKRE